MGLNLTSQTYPGKIMLFGEYSLICGSMGLVVPLKHYHGRWNIVSETKDKIRAEKSKTELERFADYLQHNTDCAALINTSQLHDDLRQGLFFDSTIPQGYGAGSSGALVAAVFERYRHDPVEKPLNVLRVTFAMMEKYFHGTSSGIDPLSCFIGKPLLIETQNEIREVVNPFSETQNIAVWLIDTKLKRETSTLMQHFNDQMLTYQFYKKLTDKLLPAVRKGIHALLERKEDIFFSELSLISRFQADEFKPMVPELLRQDWENGLSSGEFYCKICGSGGGGFMLAFSRTCEAPDSLLSKFDLIRLS